MAGNTPIIFYDLPSRDPKRCWSWNAWRTRLLLNFKGLDYVTEWTEYPDIKPKLKEHFPGKTEFTIPTIRLPEGENGTYIMDSKEIAARIEADHPTPSIHLDSPYIERLFEQLRAALNPLQPIYIYLVPTQLLSLDSVAYFHRTREEGVGMPLEELYNRDKDKVWDKAAEGFSGITALLQENEGPFFMGNTPSYADIICAGVLLFLQDLDDGVFQKALKATGDEGKAFKALLEGVKPWSDRASH